MSSVFETFSGFSSGVGIRYQPSTIVNDAHQVLASKLIIGERMIPHVFVQAADVRPVNIHDLLPSDTRFKLIIFVGNVGCANQMARLCALAEAMDSAESFLHRYGQGDYRMVFDFLCVCAAGKDDVDWTGK